MIATQVLLLSASLMYLHLLPSVAKKVGRTQEVMMDLLRWPGSYATMPMPRCPDCTFERTVENGHIHTGKQWYLCCTCGRQFIKTPANKVIDTATQGLVERLLLERISMAGIARAARVSEQ